MPRIKLAFLIVTAFALAITVAHAAPPNPAMRTLAAGTSLVLETHGCHKLCVNAPYGGYPHRHAMFSCEPRRCLINWGALLGNPVIYERRR